MQHAVSVYAYMCSVSVVSVCVVFVCIVSVCLWGVCVVSLCVVHICLSVVCVCVRHLFVWIFVCVCGICVLCVCVREGLVCSKLALLFQLLPVSRRWKLAAEEVQCWAGHGGHGCDPRSQEVESASRVQARQDTDWIWGQPGIYETSQKPNNKGWPGEAWR